MRTEYSVDCTEITRAQFKELIARPGITSDVAILTAAVQRRGVISPDDSNRFILDWNEVAD